MRRRAAARRRVLAIDFRAEPGRSVGRIRHSTRGKDVTKLERYWRSCV